jgi:rhodanese-related sulfurtransferase
VRRVAGAHLATLDSLAAAYLGDRSGVEEIDRDELARRLETGEVTVLDVRPAAEYAAGHIAGARSIPHDRLDEHLAELPRGVEVVAYCRGPYCVYADDAVRLLRRHRRRARRLRDGFPEWRDAGLPVDTMSAP